MLVRSRGIYWNFTIMNRAQWLKHLRNLDTDKITIKDRDEIDRLIDKELKEQEQLTMERAGIQLDNDGDELDEGLDAMDVEAAGEQRDREDAIRRLRGEYYLTSDGLFGLSELCATLKDRALSKQIYMMMGKLDDVEKHLNSNYKWD